MRKIIGNWLEKKKREQEVLSLPFFGFTFVFNKQNALTLDYSELYQHSSKEMLDLYVRGHYLASAMLGVYSSEVFLKTVLSMQKTEQEMLRLDNSLLSDLIKELTKYDDCHPLLSDLNHINDLRNSHLAHCHIEKFRKKAYPLLFVCSPICYPASVFFEQVSLDMIKSLSRVTSTFDKLFRQNSVGPANALFKS
jgi:hypothetical protein